ncbi:WbqC family protein [Lactobacillus helveticus]|uniref:WbqC family protein n=1 Tax=Lactobacillus helveticus TaxID=1587 RepID=UPI003ED95522
MIINFFLILLLTVFSIITDLFIFCNISGVYKGITNKIVIWIIGFITILLAIFSPTRLFDSFIFQAYNHEKYFLDVYPLIKKLIMYPTNNLADFNMNFVTKLLEYLNVNTKLIKSSDFHITSKKENKVLDILMKLHETTYLSGKESYFNYLNLSNFQSRNINIKLINYNFNSLYERDSILRLLFSYNPEEVIEILNCNGKEENP